MFDSNLFFFHFPDVPDNSFHNFEHASHVLASVKKLLTRIVANNSNSHKVGLGLVDMSGNSYGITSDPLTQFAVVFSALIHDGKSRLVAILYCTVLNAIPTHN